MQRPVQALDTVFGGRLFAIGGGTDLSRDRHEEKHVSFHAKGKHFHKVKDTQEKKEEVQSLIMASLT